MRMTKAKNPGEIVAGVGNVHRLVADDARTYSTPSFDPETYAVAYVARRWRISPVAARLICGLAALGGRCGV